MRITLINMAQGTFLLAMIFFVWMPGKHALHMFQQNRYELKRYIPWMSKAITDFGAKPALYLFFLSPLFLLLFIEDELYSWITLTVIVSLYALLLWKLEKRKQYIKPLSLTNRVRRQVVVMIILFFLITIPLVLWLPMRGWLIMVPVFYWLPWVMVLVMAFITEPIENFVKNYYIYLAKRILRKRDNLIKIGITGSYGKTSSKNILNDILTNQFYSLMTPASYNTPMGITITIRTMLKPIHQVFICEMGADKVGEIDMLTKFVKPQFGIVTSIGPQHLNTFKTLDNIINEKMKMIENLPISGVGVLNRDNEHIRNYRIKNKCQILWYGIENEDVDYRAVNIRYSPKGTSFEVITREQVSIPFETKMLGEHSVLNILAAIALGKHLGIDWERLQKAVATTRQVEHRLEVKKMNGYTVIDNAFNSNPVSSKNSLDILSLMPGKRIVMTPGMIELGEKQDEYNRTFGAMMKGKADVVLLIGKTQTLPIVEGLKESGYDMEQVVVLASVKEAFAWLSTHASKDDTVLIENDLPDAFSR
jgi:UDP-N-acetylmuramoyl-tripeptide--D-alanyl-D-alanine ligase